MKEQIELATKWLKEQDVEGCLTGSTLLGYFEGGNQDLDVFLYNEKAFAKLYYAMYYNPMFTILDPLEKWKADKYMTSKEKPFAKFGLTTLKFTWNTCIDINIILKKNCDNIFSVLSSFDMDIICKGYDLQTKQELDLTNGSTITKVANYNKWNNSFYSDEVWEISRVLRQFQRCIKYESRLYDCSAVAEKYLDLINNIEKYESIFKSTNFNEKLEITKHNTKILKEIIIIWLKTRTITDEEAKLLDETIKNL